VDFAPGAEQASPCADHKTEKRNDLVVISLFCFYSCPAAPVKQGYEGLPEG
jgi:hypothetical protein